MPSLAPGIDKIAMAERGQEAASLLPLIEEEVAGIRRGVFAKVFSKIEKGQLTPEEAVAHWQELYAAHKLLKKLETAIRMGQSAALDSPMARSTEELR